MKLVELLAKELSKWPDDAHIAIQDPDYDKTIWFLDEEHDPLEFGVNEWKCESCFKIMISRPSGLASDYKTAIVTRAQWQAERDRHKCGEWKRHRGGDKPKSVSDSDMVEVRLRCGDTQAAYADKFLWNHSDCDESVHITKYRIISQPQAEEVEVNKFCMGEKCSATAENIAHSQQCQLEHEMAYTGFKIDQIDGPIKWRDTVNELDAYIEEFTREREALINRLALEGFALIPAITAVMGVADYSGPHIESYRDWRAGDLVTGKVDYNGQFTKGRQYKLADVHVDRGRIDVEVDDKGEENGWTAHNFEFHSRP